jgi:hypothetical protein
MPAFQSFFTDYGDLFMPFPENTPTPDDLPSLSAAEIAALPVELLAILQCEIDKRLKRDKAAKTRFDAGLAVRYASRAAEERQAAGKDTGTVRFDDGDFTVVADLPKRVDWDQAQLGDVVERIRASGDDPAQYVDITIKVPERKYSAWPDGIRASFEPARMVRVGALKITLKAQGGDE